MKFIHSSKSKNEEDRIIHHVRSFCKKWEQPLQIAVSYWGKDSLDDTGLHERIDSKNSGPVQIICDLFSGSCNPNPIKTLISKKRVEVKTLRGFHAKVWICGHDVIVGSANVSINGLGSDDKESKAGNVEAAVKVSDGDVARKIQSWFREQWDRNDCVNVTKREIEKAEKIWRARGQTPSDSSVPEIPDKDLTDRFERYQIFYQGLLNALKDTDIPGKVTAPRTSGCYFRSGYSGLLYAVHFGIHKQVRVELKINGPKPKGKIWNKQTFDKIKEHQTPIEKILGAGLKWERMDNKITSHIALYRPGSIDEECDLVEIHVWFKKTLVAFKETFDPYLRKLISN